jgi:hypothetical protein
MKILISIFGILLLSGCATTAQLEAVDAKANIALAQSNTALKQSESALVGVATNSEKIDRMYSKLMSK